MTDPSIQPSTQPAKNPLFGEGAFLVAVVTAAGYYTGYMYFRSYFITLGLPLHIISIPTLELGFMALVSASLMGMLMFPFGLKPFEQPKTFWGALFGNIHLLLVIVIGIITILRSHNYLYYFVFIFCFIALLFMCWQKYSFIHFIKTLPIGSELGVVFIITLVGSQFANSMGQEHAIRTIEGRMQNSITANLFFIKGTSLLNYSQYRLVYIDSNGYYLVKLQFPAPKSPEILFISRGEVARVEMKTNE